jgi:hypothetical protein
LELSAEAIEVNILYVDWWSYNEALGAVKVRAMVEDIIPLRRAGDEPEELGEAMCMAQVFVEPGEAMCMAQVFVEPGEWPEDSQQQIDWLEAYQPEWTPMDDSGW